MNDGVMRRSGDFLLRYEKATTVRALIALIPAGIGSFGRNRRVPMTIEGELVAKSTGTVSEFSLDDRVFHEKFGYGHVVKIDGNKLTIAFDKAGEKKVVDSFVQRM